MWVRMEGLCGYRLIVRPLGIAQGMAEVVSM